MNGVRSTLYLDEGSDLLLFADDHRLAVLNIDDVVLALELLLLAEGALADEDPYFGYFLGIAVHFGLLF